MSRTGHTKAHPGADLKQSSFPAGSQPFRELRAGWNQAAPLAHARESPPAAPHSTARRKEDSSLGRKKDNSAALQLHGFSSLPSAAPGSASPPFFAPWSPFPPLPLLSGSPLRSQLGAGPCRPLIGQRHFHPALAGLWLVSGRSIPFRPASHWSAAAPSRPRWPLNGQRQLRPAPGGISPDAGSTETEARQDGSGAEDSGAGGPDDGPGMKEPRARRWGEAAYGVVKGEVEEGFEQRCAGMNGWQEPGSGTAARLAALQLSWEVEDVAVKEEVSCWDVPLFFP
ncbi:translation initiation factor IF-2-like [Gallus gallus]|uniref:translation initiation factor IF-2-like n=1 Tax=Gallus gallus TaxID=9031 RepID=UPI001AE3618B|nr:translation initiation factor IF-2-like [Gallus gallus]